MFAGDSKLFRIIKSPQHVQILQEDFNFILNWSRLWLLKFNTLKCTVIHLGSGENNTYTLYDQTSETHFQLESTTEQRDLSVWITPDMGSTRHKIASNTNQVLNRLKHSFRIRSAPIFTVLWGLRPPPSFHF